MIKKINKMDKTELTKNIPFFKNLSDQEIDEISHVIETSEYKKGDILIHQGDKASEAFFILKGLVKIYKITEDGEIVSLAMLGKEEIVGEMSLFIDIKRTASVEAIQDTVTLKIEGEAFQKLLENNPKTSIKILKILIGRLINTNQQLEDSYYKNIYQRVWKSLMILAKHFPENNITISHEELSEIVGATRARVTEVLNTLQEENKIRLSRKSISIINN